MIDPGERYRLLAVGELVADGDEWVDRGTKIWHRAVGLGRLCNADEGRYRRPIRIQSEGWRYLDPGEQLQAGDQVYLINDAQWKRATIGSPVYVVYKRKSEAFRRQITTSSRVIGVALNSSTAGGFIFIQVPKIELQLCGCGQHSFDVSADPYAAHQSWVKALHREEGKGISVKPQAEVLGPDMWEP